MPDPLDDKRHETKLKFLTRFLNGSIYSPKLVSLISFEVPPRSTVPYLFF